MISTGCSLHTAEQIVLNMCPICVMFDYFLEVWSVSIAEQLYNVTDAALFRCIFGRFFRYRTFGSSLSHANFVEFALL